VPKILVADDNSNIQKMVGLALKDQGIDVVAVGNGEAAVRKISDVKPDLVLADVFMPVRNGYEVCKFVKDDPSLAHIPVILLVGAFDPLDEQEAQRVGADGVLKKPFVPPDPLISMVKSALARAGIAVGAPSAADKTPQPGTLKTTDLLPKPAAPVPMAASIPVPEPAREFVPVLEDQSFVDEVPTGPVPVKIDAGSQPLAFGSMLEAPTTKEEEDMDFVPPSNKGLVPERDWSSTAEPEEDPEETVDDPKQSWRRDAADEAFEANAPTKPEQDWRDTAIANAIPGVAQKNSYDGWQPTKEKSPLTEAAEVSASSNGAATEVRGVTSPDPTSFAAPAAASDAWAKAIGIAQEERPAETQPEVAAPVVEAQAPVAPEVKEPSNSSWFSAPASPWETVAEKANKLASTWDAAVATAPVVEEKTESAPATELETEPSESAVGAYAAESLLSQETDESVPEPTNVETAGTAPLVHEEAKLEEFVHTQPVNAESTATLPAEAVTKVLTEEVKESGSKSESQDDLVARVLAKMSPEMLQAVTREILKPVVEAMVKEELNAKK
jgi:CheY-like chemotaxis protein